MNQEHMTDVLLEIKTQVSSLDTKLTVLSETLLKHEQRITELEHQHIAKLEEERSSSFKEQIIQLLMKCLLISLTAIGSLVGVGSIMSQILK